MGPTGREELASLQEEAKRRVLDMRARSRFAAEQMNRDLQPEAAAPEPRGDSQSREDAERMFLLSLCLLLSNEGADESVILALMYLMT